MPSSAELYILNKLSELVQRCGVSPVDPEIVFSYISRSFDPFESPPAKVPTYIMEGIEPYDDEINPDADQIKRNKVYSLLGLDNGTGRRGFDSLDEALEVVEKALALAPRARARAD